MSSRTFFMFMGPDSSSSIKTCALTGMSYTPLSEKAQHLLSRYGDPSASFPIQRSGERRWPATAPP